MTTRVVVDASAVLAVVFQERGQDSGAPALPGASISAVNLAEVMSKMLDRGLSPERIDRQLDELSLAVADFDRNLAIQAALLRKITRHKGLSLGDRACLALAMREKRPVLTGDTAWSDLDLPVQVVLIR